MTSFLTLTLMCFAAPFDSTSLDSLNRFFNSDFVLVGSASQIPVLIDWEQMADPGAPYNVTDVVDDPPLPFQRLKLAGRADSLWFVYYEEGGFTHTWNFVLFEISRPNVRALFAAYLIQAPEYSSLDELKSGLASLPLLTVPDRPEDGAWMWPRPSPNYEMKPIEVHRPPNTR